MSSSENNHVFYDIRENRSLKDSGEKRRVIVYRQSKQHMTYNNVLEHIEENCSLRQSDVKSAVKEIAEAIKSAIANGYSVTLDDIGTFFPRLRYNGTATDVNDVKEGDVTVDSIGFLPGSDLKSHIKSIKCRRFPYATHSISDLSMEKIKTLLEQFFATKNKTCITHSEFHTLTGLSTTQAYRKMNSLRDMGALCNVSGSNRYKIFEKVADNNFWK